MELRKLASATTIATLAVVPASAFAQTDQGDLSYTYFEGQYVNLDIDAFEDDDLFDNTLEDFDDGNGWGFLGSFAFSENFFVEGSYRNTDADFSFVDDTGAFIPSDQDVKTLRLGAGWRTPIAESADFVMRAHYVDMDFGDFDVGAGENELDGTGDIRDAFDDLNDDASDGFSLDAGARGQVMPWLEAAGGIRYTDMDWNDDVSFYGNLLFEVSPNFGVNLSGDFGDEIIYYGAGLRYTY